MATTETFQPASRLSIEQILSGPPPPGMFTDQNGIYLPCLLEFLQEMNLSPDILSGTPPHRVSRLQRHGEGYFVDGLRDISSDRRLAIIAVCTVT